MSKKIRYLVKLLHGTFSNSLTESLALKTRFKIRQGKLTPDMFVRLCVLYGKDLCESSLNRLHSRLFITDGIDISPQALDQRFNVNAVAFLKELFEALIYQHNEAMIEKGELHLKDLGYYKVSHFKKIESEGAFYISKIKRTTTAYVKNPNPEFKKDGTIDKRTEYIKIDIQELTQPLLEGQSVEFLDIYIGLAKLKARLIITKLSEESKKSREKVTVK
ncbi:MAG TPA: hypothetical protein GX707_16305 [Epulopiscium sp.]|nr:hypothetical protein [Candidatus Epulonipiscium sp.]